MSFYQDNKSYNGTNYLSSHSEKVIQGPTQHSYSAYSTTKHSGPTTVTTSEYTSGPIVTSRTSGNVRHTSIGGGRLVHEGLSGVSGVTTSRSHATAKGGALIASGAQFNSGRHLSGHTTDRGQYYQGNTVVSTSGWNSSAQSRHLTEGTSYTTGNIVQTFQGQERVIDTRVVGVERGSERLVSTTELEGESVVHERYESQRVKVPKKIIREEVIEKVYIVPETIQIEEYVEDEVEVEEKIVEVAKKIIIEKIVEVPEIEIIEKIIEVPETVVREKIKEVAKIEQIEKIVEVPVEQIVERCVSVPQIEYKDVPVEKIVEVPEVRTEEVIREVCVPQHAERGIERVIYIEEAFDIERKLPVPVEAEIVLEYCLPGIVPRYSKKKFPVYLPRFIEVPISRQFADAGMLSQGEAFASRVHSLTTIQPAMSLCEIENLAKEIKDVDFVRLYESKLSSGQHFESVVESFKNGQSFLSNISNTGISKSVSHYSSHMSGSHITGGKSYHSSSHVTTGPTISNFRSSQQLGTAKGVLVNQSNFLNK